MVGEELPGGLRTVLLTHEEHRRVRRRQQQRRRAGQPVDADELRQALARRAVADLIVRLQGRDKAPTRRSFGIDGAAVAALAEARVRAVVEERRRVHLGEGCGGREVLVVALRLAGEQHVQGVVDVVGPLPAQPEAGAATVGDRESALTRARFARTRRDGGRVVAVGLGDDDDVATRLLGGEFQCGRELFEDVDGRVVGERVDGVKAERVDVELGEPHERVLDDEAAHLVTLRAVEVDGGAPRRVVQRIEVGAELGQVVAARAEVVVDDVQADGEAARVARVDEALEGGRATVGGARRVPVDTVIAPVSLSRNAVHRQDLDVCHPERHEVIEPFDGRVERPGFGERADVQLVEDRAAHRVVVRGRVRVVAAPTVVLPVVGREVDDLAGAVDALGLQQRTRVGARVAAVDAEGVLAADAHRLGRMPPAVLAGLHGRLHAVGDEMHHALGGRRPHRDRLGRAVKTGRGVGVHRFS